MFLKCLFSNPRGRFRNALVLGSGSVNRVFAQHEEVLHSIPRVVYFRVVIRAHNPSTERGRLEDQKFTVILI